MKVLIDGGRMTRREARKALGTRSQRRAGTKTKCMPSTMHGAGAGDKLPEFRFFKRQRARPRTRLKRLLEERAA